MNQNKHLAPAFGATLRSARAKRGLSQTDVAGHSGIGRGRLSELENGRHTPNLETVIRLAAALGTPAWNLLRCTELRLAKRESGVTEEVVI